MSRVRKKKLLTLLGLSLTGSSGLSDSDVPPHSSGLPISVITAEDKDFGTVSGTSPGRE